MSLRNENDGRGPAPLLIILCIMGFVALVVANFRQAAQAGREVRPEAVVSESEEAAHED